jgi:hypothetical protein
VKRNHPYPLRANLSFPALSTFGLGLIVFPIDTEEWKVKYGVDRPQSLFDMPADWILVLVVAIAAALLNWGMLASRYQL